MEDCGGTAQGRATRHRELSALIGRKAGGEGSSPAYRDLELCGACATGWDVHGDSGRGRKTGEL